MAIRQITINLLTNALKYSSENIFLSIKNHGYELNIIIEDQGIGIPETDKAHIFEKFYRASNVSNIAGTGLGMSIIQRTLELCHGNMEFSSNLNQGTKFIINIPSSKD